MATWITPVEVTPGSASSWVDVDVSAQVPAGTTGVMLHVVNTSGSSLAIGLRKNGSTDARTDTLRNSSHMWAAIGVDGSYIFECYVGSTTSIDVYLVGTFGSEAVFNTNATAVTPGTKKSWQDIDIAAATGADTAIGAIVELVGSEDPNWDVSAFGLRKNGSTDARYQMFWSHRWAIIGVDGSEIFECWCGTGATVYLVGYITSGVTFNTNATDITLGTFSAWTDLTALPTGATGAIIEVLDPASADNYGLRKNGSSEAITRYATYHAWALVECDTNYLIEGYGVETNTVPNFYVIGYTTAAASAPVYGEAALTGTASLSASVGATWYVSKGATGANNGTSWTDAWNELDQITWASINPGDTIVIDGGTTSKTYSTTMTLGASGTAASPIVIQRSDETDHDGQILWYGGRPYLLPYRGQSSYTYVTSGVNTVAIDTNSKSHVTIDGRTWSGIKIYGFNGYPVQFSTSTQGIKLRYMEITDNGTAYQSGGLWYSGFSSGGGQCGVQLAGTSHVFERLLVHNNAEDSFQSFGASGNITWTECWLYNDRVTPDGGIWNYHKHPDGVQIWNGGDQSGYIMERSVVGPGWMQGFILGQPTDTTSADCHVDNFTIRDTLIYGCQTSNIYLLGRRSPRGWTLERVTSDRPTDLTWRNFEFGWGPSQSASYPGDPTQITVRDCIFTGGLAVKVPSGGNYSGNYYCDVNMDWGSVGTALSAEPYFYAASHGSYLAATDFRVAAGSPAAGKGASIASGAQLVRLGTTLSGTTWTATQAELTGPFALIGDTTPYITQTKNVTATGDGGIAIYRFNVSAAGNYYLTGTVRAPDGGTNSFWVEIDDEPDDPDAIWDVLPYTSSLTARRVTWRGTGTEASPEYPSKTWALTAGDHYVTIRGREPGVRLSSLSLSLGGLSGTSIASTTGLGVATITGGTEIPTTPTSDTGWPDLYVELALTTRPRETAIWQDVSAYVYRVHIRRGRQHELDRFETGTCTVEFDDSDGRFDPGNTLGPYYGKLLPMRRLRVRAGWNNDFHPQYSGFIENWQPARGNGVSREVTVEVVDGFKVLGLAKLNRSFDSQLTSDRLHAVLDEVSWTSGYTWVLDSTTNSQLGTTTILGPVNDRLIATGDTTVQASTLEDVTALEHVHAITTAENGLTFMGKDGALTFVNRHRQNQPAYEVDLGTFGDDSGDINYSEYEPVYDDSEIYNEVRCQREGGVLQTASDATSQLDYFRRTYSLTNLLINNDTEVADRAQWTLGRYKDPRWRAKTIGFNLTPGSPTTLWTQVLDREIGDRISVARRLPDGTAVAQDYHIEGIEMDILPGRKWQVRWALSVADPTQYWLVSGAEGDDYAANAVLGTTTVLAY